MYVISTGMHVVRVFVHLNYSNYSSSLTTNNAVSTIQKSFPVITPVGFTFNCMYMCLCI